MERRDWKLQMYRWNASKSTIDQLYLILIFIYLDNLVYSIMVAQNTRLLSGYTDIKIKYKQSIVNLLPFHFCIINEYLCGPEAFLSQWYI